MKRYTILKLFRCTNSCYTGEFPLTIYSWMKSIHLDPLSSRIYPFEFVNISWNKTLVVLHEFSTEELSCRNTECKSDFLSGFGSDIFGKLNLPTYTLISKLNTSVDLLSNSIIIRLNDYLCVCVADVNRHDMSLPTTLGLRKLAHSQPRLIHTQT